MLRSWIHFTRGRFVRQARVGLGELREEHLSRQGFQGPVAMLYRLSGPNEVVRIEGDYRPRLIDSADVAAADAGDPRGAWQVMLSNDDVSIAISRRRAAMPYRYRDMDGDLLYFVHRGTGTFATEFGPIAYVPGDYVMLPKATTYRHLPDPGDSLFLVVESAGPIRMAEHENVGRHTPIDPTMLQVPTSSITAGPRKTSTSCASSMPAATPRFSTKTTRSPPSAGRAICSRSSSTCATSCRSCRTASTSRRRRG